MNIVKIHDNVTEMSNFK